MPRPKGKQPPKPIISIRIEKEAYALLEKFKEIRNLTTTNAINEIIKSFLKPLINVNVNINVNENKNENTQDNNDLTNDTINVNENKCDFIGGQNQTINVNRNIIIYEGKEYNIPDKYLWDHEPTEQELKKSIVSYNIMHIYKKKLLYKELDLPAHTVSVFVKSGRLRII